MIGFSTRFHFLSGSSGQAHIARFIWSARNFRGTMSLEISRQVHDEYKEVFMYFSEEARTQGDKAKIGTDEFTTVRAPMGK